MKITANEQVFQTIYVNIEAKDWKEKIVFIEPYFESLPPAVIQLKTVKHDDKLGIVISGSENDIQNYRQKIEDYDNEHKLGEYSNQDIFDNLVTIAKEDMNLTLEYMQNGESASQPKQEEEALAYLFKKKDYKSLIVGSIDALKKYSDSYLQSPIFYYDAEHEGDKVLFTIKAKLRTTKKVKEDSYKTYATTRFTMVDVDSSFIKKKVFSNHTLLETYIEIDKDRAYDFAKELKNFIRGKNV